jgi:SAM-dependent methyltransferase
MARDWNERYRTGEMPWDTGHPDPELVALVKAGRLPPGRALDVGCGTGTTVRYLAELGYDALGVDVAPLAVEQASARPRPARGSAEFRHLDFLAAPPAGPFDLVLDRGCFHVFDGADERARFAARVAECLAPNGLWVSLLGSTEGPARDHGPPRRSARDIAAAVEPVLEIAELRAATFDADLPSVARAWVLLARRRRVPAQPSTVHPDS